MTDTLNFGPYFICSLSWSPLESFRYHSLYSAVLYWSLSTAWVPVVITWHWGRKILEGKVPWQLWRILVVSKLLRLKIHRMWLLFYSFSGNCAHIEHWEQVNPYAADGWFGQYKMKKKTLKYDWNPGIWVLIGEYSGRAIKWIPIWQGLDDFRWFSKIFPSLYFGRK